MPGSFSFDTILPPKLDVNVGAKSHFFQPPKTPSASSSLHRSTSSLLAQDVISIGGTASRKRSRHDSHLSAAPFKVQSHASPSMLSYTQSGLQSPSFLSPAPLVNTQYRLAGGLDTPTARLSMDEGGEYRTSPDLLLRGGRFGGYELAPDSYFPQSASALSRESNGRPRQHDSPRAQASLGKAVHGVVSVAGKVWDFCRTAAFKVRMFRITWSCLGQSLSHKTYCGNNKDLLLPRPVSGKSFLTSRSIADSKFCLGVLCWRRSGI